MELAVKTTHIDLLHDDADLLAYLFERDLKWYHAALSLNGSKVKVCTDLRRRINASRAIAIPPMELYEVIDEALGTSTLHVFYSMPSPPTFDVKAFIKPEPPSPAPTIKVVKKGQEEKRVFVVKKKLPKMDYDKVARLASTWQTDTQLARYLNMDRKTLAERMLADSQFREAVELGRRGRSRGDRKNEQG